MNCKPGDLAVCIGGERPENIGLFCRVLRVYVGPNIWRMGADWVVEFKGREVAACDRHLRPIRDPGEDATDETLLWLPAPKQTEAA